MRNVALIKGTPDDVVDIIMEERQQMSFDDLMVYSPIGNIEKRICSYQLLQKSFT